MGDGEKDAKDYLLDAYNLVKVDILKIGHHGSSNGQNNDFPKNPQISLISAGKIICMVTPTKNT